MNPVVIIATHNRLEITNKNISLLQEQSFAPRIVIVATDASEGIQYKSKFDVDVILASNNPLGAKWQAGIDYARTLSASHVIITGSDDILSSGFVRKFCTDIPFTGLQRWYIYDPSHGSLYLFDYLAAQPLGGGRVYTSRLLDAYGWQLFDNGKNRLLDDKGWEITNPLYRKIIRDEGHILAIKGNWPVMNPLKVTLQHKNAKLIKKCTGVEAKMIIKEKFGY